MTHKYFPGSNDPENTFASFSFAGTWSSANPLRAASDSSEGEWRYPLSPSFLTHKKTKLAVKELQLLNSRFSKMAPGNSFFFSNKANSKGLKLQMKEYSCWFNLKRLASNSFNPEKSKLAVKKHLLSPLWPLRREFAYRRRFCVETVILRAFFDQK